MDVPEPFSQDIKGPNDSVRLLPRGDVGPAAELLQLELDQEPLHRYLLPDAGIRKRVLPTLSYALVAPYIKSRRAYGIGHPLSGLSIWLKPKPGRVIPSLRHFVAQLRVLFGPYGRAMFRERDLVMRIENMRRHWAPDPHYYLLVLAIRQDQEGRGLEPKLIAPMFSAADSEGVTCYASVAQPEAASVLESLGFRLMEKYEVRDSDLTLYALLRPPSERAVEFQ